MTKANIKKTDSEEYARLYDFAPIGYFTLSKAGAISRMNRFGADLLGIDPLNLPATKFEYFVSDDSKPVFFQFFEDIFKYKNHSSCNLTIESKRKGDTFMHLEAIFDEPDEQCLLSMIDISQQKANEDQLKSLLSLTDATLNSIHNGILVIDRQGKVIKSNARFAEMWHIPSNILNSGDDKTLLEFVLGQLADPDEFLAKVNELYSKPAAESRDLIYFSDSRIFERISKPMFIGNEPIARVWSFLNITEQVQTQKALRDSRSTLIRLFDTMTEGVVEITADGKIVSANPAAEHILGISKNEIENRNFLTSGWDIIRTNGTPMPPEEMAGPRSIHEKKPVKDVVMGIRRPDGIITWVNVCASPLFKDTGEIEGFVGTFADITERKIAEDRLEQTRYNFDSFFNTIDELLFVLDEQANIIQTNSTVNERLGFSKEELFGKSVLTVHPPDRWEEAGRIVGEMLAGKAELCPVPVITKSGSLIPVETRVKLGIWDGKPAIFGVTKDISRLRFSEEKFSKVFHLNPLPCGLSDLTTGQYVELNAAFYDFFGFTSEEVIGKTAFELGIMTPETKKAILASVGSSQRIVNVKTILKTNHGEYKTVLLTAENIYVQDKAYRFTFVHDITELTQAQDALKISEAKYKNIYETANEAIIIASDTKIVECNFRTEELFHIRREGLIGRDISELSPVLQPDGQPSLIKIDKIRAASKSETQFFEWELVRPDGTSFYAEVSVGVLEFSDPPLYQAIIRDVTDKKLAHKALKESELRYRTLFNTSPSGIIVLDENGIILDVNDAVATTALYNHEELIGKNIAILAHEDAVKDVPDHIQRILTDETLECEVVNRKKDGSKYHVILRESAITLPNGQKGIISVSNDITLRKQMEIDLKKSEEKLILKNTELQTLNAQKDKFFSIIAHDLKSPFNCILGFSDMLNEDADNLDVKDIKHYASVIYNAANQTLLLLENLLNWARMQQGRMEFSQKNLLLHEIADEVIGFLTDASKQKAIAITNTIQENMIVQADENMIKTTIRNLASNAIKFTRQGGFVEISAKSTDNEIQVSVSDTGIGISAENIGKLFDVGSSYTTRGTNNEKGTGLGLILCKEFVEKHGGRIWVESEPGQGSAFSFSLPL